MGTNKGLKLRHGNQERVFRLEFVSNMTWSDGEFSKWRETVMLGGMSLPNIKEVEAKGKAISDALVRKMGDSDINHMIKEKERFMVNPRNYAMHKSRVIKERDDAVQDGDEEKTELLNKKLASLEERAEELDRARSSKISSIALINDKNRKRNIMRAEKGIREEIARKKREGEVDDPFTRRQTRPTRRKKEEVMEPEKITSQWLAEQAAKEKMEAEKGNVVDSKTEGKKKDNLDDDKKENKPAAPVDDLFNAHNFDITIDLDVSDKNATSNVSLKPVAEVKKSTGPKKSLNLADYKKKRGLI